MGLSDSEDSACPLFSSEDAAVSGRQATNGDYIAMTNDHHSFSFTKSAEAHGRPLITAVIQAALRPPISDIEHPFYGVEQEACKALGLDENAKMIVIERARCTPPPHDNPVAFHRAYLDPARFPEEFLQHDFSAESLMDLYSRYGSKAGYSVESRDTVLSARGANIYEVNLIRSPRFHANPHGRVVLDAQQRLYARDAATGKLFVLEFLQASYLEDWKYEIKNRPA